MMHHGSDFDDHLDESMDNMESLILHPPEYTTANQSTYSSGTAASASHSYFSLTEDDPLFADQPPPPYHEALAAPRVTAMSASSSSSSSPRSTTHAAGSSSASVPWDSSAAVSPEAARKDREPGSSGTPAVHQGSSLFVQVLDPQKHLDASSSSMLPGGGTYVSYGVVTQTDLPEYGPNGRFKVRRRFKEFVALADRLAETHRGYFVPARPDKSVLENQLLPGKEFVEMRRIELEKYLQRLAKHPVIRRSQEMVIFLTTEGKLPILPKTDLASRMLEGAAKLPGQLMGGSDAASVPTAAEAVKPAGGGRDLFRMFKEFSQSVANEWVGGQGLPAADGAPLAPPDPTEQALAACKIQLTELEKHLSDASVQAENLVRAQSDLSRIGANLGLSLLAMSKLQDTLAQEPLPGTPRAQQDSQRAVAEACKAGGTVLVKQSRLEQQATRESIQQLALLHEYMKSLLTARLAFADRAQAHVTVQTLTADIAAKHAKLEKLNQLAPRPGDVSRVRKGVELEHEKDVLTKSKAAAEAELQRIKERNVQELNWFDGERKADMSRMLEQFAHIQAISAERTAQLWESSADLIHSRGKGKAVVNAS